MNSEAPTKKTILVVEDDFGIRECMRVFLEYEGYRVVAAANGQEGLDKVRQLPRPSLVLLDMLMPVMNGRGFLDVILKDPVLSLIPILIVSAATGTESLAGATAVISKPVNLDSLLASVVQYAN